MVRNPAAAQGKLPYDVTVVKGDVYEFGSVARAAAGCDAIIVTAGATDIRDPFGPFNTEYQGTLNTVAAAQQAGVKHVVLVTSIGTDDAIVNPLNLFWGILFWKKRAEEVLQRSGLTYTVIRPGGLVGPGESSQQAMPFQSTNRNRGTGNVVMRPAGTYGIPPRQQAGSIQRTKVRTPTCSCAYDHPQPAVLRCLLCALAASTTCLCPGTHHAWCKQVTQICRALRTLHPPCPRACGLSAEAVQVPQV